MGADQQATVAAVRPLIESLIGGALDKFYDRVRNQPETSPFFRDAGHMTSAKSAQATHWMNIARGQFDASFYDSVRRIGTVHARIGLEPRWYVGAYALVLENLLEGIGRHYSPWRRLVKGSARRARPMPASRSSRRRCSTWNCRSRCISRKPRSNATRRSRPWARR
ncbi:protoglobin domain-containing protein [Sphingomonas aerolata]